MSVKLQLKPKFFCGGVAWGNFMPIISSLSHSNFFLLLLTWASVLTLCCSFHPTEENKQATPCYLILQHPTVFVFKSSLQQKMQKVKQPTSENFSTLPKEKKISRSSQMKSMRNLKTFTLQNGTSALLFYLT